MAASTRKGLPTQDPQVLTIVGEQVSLKPTGLAGTDNIMVGFDEKYKPAELKQDEVDLLKRTLQRLFSRSGFYFGDRSPNPPCNKKEKELVLKSLKYRFVKLRTVVQAERERDSLYFRQSLKHLFDLKGYIDWFEKAPCKDGDEILKGALGDLSDDDIKKLLKQFVFLILQGQNPLEDYESVDPNPAAFVGRLKEGALGDFNTFLEAYRSKNYPIPERISKVLEVADLDLNAMREAIQDAIAGKLKEIIDTMRSTLEDPENPLCEGIDLSVITADTILKVFDCLVEKVKASKGEMKGLTDDLSATKQALAEIESKLKGKDDEISLLNGRIAVFEAQVADLKSQIANHEGSEKELQESLDHANNTISQLKGIIERLTAEKAQLEEMYRGLLAKLEEQTEEIRRLREVILGLQAKLSDVQKTKGTNEEAEQRMKNLQELEDAYSKALAKIGDLENQKAQLSKELNARITTLLEEKDALIKNKEIDDGLKDTEIAVRDGEIGTLQQKIRDLNVQVDSLNERIRALEAEKTQLLQDKETQQFALEAQESLVNELQEEKEQLLANIRVLQQDNRTKQTQIDELKAQAQTLSGRIEALQAEKEKLISDAELAEFALNQQESLIGQLRDEREELMGRIIQMENRHAQEVAVKDDKIGTLESEKEALTAEVREIRRQLEELTEQKNTNEATIRDQQNSLKTLEEEKARLQKQSSVDHAQIQALEELEAQHKRTIETLTTGEGGLQTRIAELTRSLETKEQELATLRGDKEYLNQKIKEIMARLVAEKKRADDLQTQMTNEVNRLNKALADSNILLEDTKKSHKAALDVLADDYEEQLVALQKKIADQEKQIAGLVNERSALSRKVNELQNKITALEQSKVTEDSELATLRQEKADLEKQLAENDANLQAEIRRLQGLLQGKEAEFNALKQRYDDLEKQGKAKQAELEGVVAGLRNELSTQGTELTGTKQNLAGVEAELKACKEARAALEQRATTAEASAAKLAELQTSLEAVQDQLVAAQADIQTLTQEKDTLQETHEAEIKRLNDEHDAELAEKDRAHQEEIASLREAHSQEILGIKDQHQRDVIRLNEEHEARIAELRAEYQGQLAQLSQQLVQAKEDCEERIRVATESLNQQILAAQEALTTMKAERDALQALLTTTQTERDALKAEKITKDGQIGTLEAEKAELEDAVESRDILVQEKDREIGELKLDQEAKLAKAQATIDKQANNIRERDATIQTLSESKGAQLALNDVTYTVQQIAKWVKAGAKGDQPEITGRAKDITTEDRTNPVFKSIIDDILALERSGTPSENSDVPSERAEIIRESYTCYLVFFASYLWGRHFPAKVEQRDIQRDKLEVMERIPKILELGSGASEARDIPAQASLYQILESGQAGFDLEGEDPRMLTLNTITKVMLKMEEIHDLGIRDKSYAFYSLTPKEIKVIQALKQVTENILKIDGTGVSAFNLRLHFLVIHRGGPVDKDLTSVCLSFNKETNKPIIRYYGTDAISEKNKLTFILNFPFLFYVYLFVFKDYLNMLEPEAQCPLPTILQKRPIGVPTSP